jgi:hypothetical protein
MTSVKAKLAVILKANDVVVAEVDDARLWQRVLTAISGGDLDMRTENGDKQADSGVALPAELIDTPRTRSATQPLNALAQKIGSQVALIEGACAPGSSPPYIHLDPHCWEEMRRQVPRSGPNAVPPIALAATLLALWFGVSGLRNPTQAQAQAVLNTINVRDKNASRGIRGTTWLQNRPGGEIVLNPAQVSRAVELARCFCSKEWALWKKTPDTKS